jgi:peptide/nickel transport system substrate-binding protein
MTEHAFTRRSLLRGGGGLLLLATAGGCGFFDTSPAKDAGGPAAAADLSAKEAPSWSKPANCRRSSSVCRRTPWSSRR